MRNSVSRLFFLSICILFIGCGANAFAQNTKAQENKKAKLQKEIAIIDSQLRNVNAQKASAMSKLALVKRNISARKELISESDKAISEYDDSIASKEAKIAVVQARLDTLSDYYNRLIKGAYKNRNAKVWYMYIIASDNIGQAFRRYGYLRDLSKQMNIQAEKIKETKETLETEKASLESMKQKAEAVRKERVSEVGKLQGEEADSQALVNQLNKNKKKYQAELAQKQREVDALNREIARIIREAMNSSSAAPSKSKSKPNGNGSTKTPPSKPIDYTLAKEFEANKGKLPWPAEGPIVDRFGERYHPVYTKIKLPFNNGITIALNAGTPVKAVFNGVVKQIVVMPGYNKCVLIQHGNYFSFYCKLGSVNVKAGDKVKTSQVIGTVDTINGETQLHFQIWSGKTPQNPENWLR